MSQIYFDCFSGLSGDMILGALIDLGVRIEDLKSELGKLHLHGYRLEVTPTTKHGIAATKLNVHLEHHDHDHDHHHRGLREILDMIDSSSISESARETAKEVFNRLAEAEAKVHNTTKEEVHFHEVGAVDSIVDIVGTAIALDLLGVEHVYSSPIALGTGFTKSAHGTLPIPVPATVELLKGVPVRHTEINSELTTPTGAAIISTLAESFGPMPFNRISRIGYGAGFKEISEQPNLLRIFLCDEKSDLEADTVVSIETNIDDSSPEILGYVMERLMKSGALDVFFTPIFMKKNRPATKLSVITEKGAEQELAEIILAETSTIGVRFVEMQRMKLPRRLETVATPFGEITVKVTETSHRTKIAPEYESCRKAAESSGKPIAEIYQAAIDAAKQ